MTGYQVSGEDGEQFASTIRGICKFASIKGERAEVQHGTRNPVRSIVGVKLTRKKSSFYGHEKQNDSTYSWASTLLKFLVNNRLFRRIAVRSYKSSNVFCLDPAVSEIVGNPACYGISGKLFYDRSYGSDKKSVLNLEIIIFSNKFESDFV